MNPPPTVHFITNGVFSTSIAGGDIHFLKIAQGVAAAGYPLHFFGGHALQEVVRQQGLSGNITLTDKAAMPKVNASTLTGQVALFRDMYRRYQGLSNRCSVFNPGISSMLSLITGLMCCLRF